MIAWTYLDKKSAAIDALKDHDSMKYIIDTYPGNMLSADEKMNHIPSSAITGMPRVGDMTGNEDRIVSAIDEIDVLRERYRQALEYMEWFEPAWDNLSDDDRYILTEYYFGDEKQTDSIYNICDHFHIERTSAYNKKNRSLTKLALLLYGK